MRKDYALLGVEFAVGLAFGKRSNGIVMLAELYRSSKVNASYRYTELLRELNPYSSSLGICIGIVLKPRQLCL